MSTIKIKVHLTNKMLIYLQFLLFVLVAPLLLANCQNKQADNGNNAISNQTSTHNNYIPANIFELPLTKSEITIEHNILSGRIAFSSRLNDHSDIFVVDTNKNESWQITNNQWSDLAPKWSPDGMRIAYYAVVGKEDHIDNFELFIADLTSGKIEQLTDNNVEDSSPSWSPDGEKIIYTSKTTGNFELFTLNLTTGETIQLTDNLNADYSPVWSPDGKYIAFTSSRGKGDPGLGIASDIFMMDTDGTNIVQLTQAYSAGNPVWSPNSQYIAYDVGLRTTFIEIVDVYTGNIFRLLEPGMLSILNDEYVLSISDPAWSPDGKYIAFTISTMNRTQIFITTTEFGQVREVIDLGEAFLGSQPDWTQ